MKFGRNLERNQVPEWKASYIKYKALKKLIKSVAEDALLGEGVDTAEFFYFLDRNLEDVDRFYNKKYADATRRLKLLQDRYGRPSDIENSFDKDDIEDLMGALLELRGQLKHLQWYGEVNRRGFIKITKKLDKKVGRTATQKRYLETKVDPKQFATNIDLLETKAIVNEWIPRLAEVKVRDDASSTNSSHSLKRATSKAVSNLPVGLLDSLDSSIRNDDVSTLVERLSRATRTANEGSDEFQKALCLSLLQRAAACKAKDCTAELLSRLPSLDETDDINDRNCIHRLIITAGRLNPSDDEKLEPAEDPLANSTNYLKPAVAPVLVVQKPAKLDLQGPDNVLHTDDTVDFLKYLFNQLKPQQRSAIRARDVYGRTPLHYAAQYGFVSLCKIIIAHMQDWKKYEDSSKVGAPFWQDVDGLAPLHLSVIGGHPLTTKALLEAGNKESTSSRAARVRKALMSFGEVLALAVKANFTVIVDLLVGAGVDVDYQDHQGETALHVAARFGHSDCAKILMTGGFRRASLEIPEISFGWTPLHVACVDGHFEIVVLLIANGAGLEKPDVSGWTAKEHATLRGHMRIAKLLAGLTSTAFSVESVPSTTAASGSHGYKSLADRKSNAISNGNGNGNGNMRSPEPIKTFGHRYLTKESMILVSLGTMDNRKQVEPVNLDHIPLADAHSTQLDTALSVIVSAQGASGEPSIIDLPVQDNVSTEPFVFNTTDPSKVKLLFDIVPTYAGSSKEIVGRGVALLSTIKPSVGSKRISLQGDVSVPIVAANNLDVIGSVNFNFLIITPFSHPNMAISEDLTYWRTMASTMVIGHRGLGKNVASRGSLQLGENTIQSFIAAANLGASYVEFDVQLTKDHVPVIYHDFLVSETGIDAPVHTLTLEQFLHINDARPSRTSRASSPARPLPQVVNASTNSIAESRKYRSMSVSDANRDENADNAMSERMKNTRDFKEKGFKANTRGNFIQGAFTTLEDMFRELPESTGFNIEMKYPMLYESELQEMDAFAVELNAFVDAVLDKVYDWGGTKKRNIIFSSFNPDICLLLSFKQPSIPVLFLTDGGESPVGDIRASSLQEAIRFASRWNLLGVVSAAAPLIISPRLVRVVKESGLVCVSYGSLNNDPEKVHIQVKEGIDAVIVDSVLKIRKGLTSNEATNVAAA